MNDNYRYYVDLNLYTLLYIQMSSSLRLCLFQYSFTFSGSSLLPSSGSSGWVERVLRNMKSIRPPLAAIFFMT